MIKSQIHVITSTIKYIYSFFIFYPTDQAKGTSYWSLIDKLVQQVTLQQKDGTNPDTEVAEIDVHKVVRQ